MMLWKTIDTVPKLKKNSPYVILGQADWHGGYRVTVGRWARPLLGSWGWFNDSGHRSYINPTHWAELTDPGIDRTFAAVVKSADGYKVHIEMPITSKPDYDSILSEMIDAVSAGTELAGSAHEE